MNRIIKFNRLLLHTVILLSMGQVISWADNSANPASSAPLQNTVAKVNGLPIYETALNSEMKRIAAKGWTTGMAGNTEEAIKLRKSKALETLVANELIRQASLTHAVVDIENKVSQRILEMKKKYPSEEDFTTVMKRKNKTIENLREDARIDIQFLEYLNKVKTQDIRIPDSDVDKFYNDKKTSFIVPEQIKARHILVKIDGSSDEQVSNALKKATELRKKVLELKNFNVVAKESSSCASAANGGELDYISRGKMPADFDKVAFSLKVGELSDPVKTSHGFHIIEVLDKKPEYVRPLKEVKEFITTYLKQQAGNERIKSHIVELKNKARIEIVPN